MVIMMNCGCMFQGIGKVFDKSTCSTHTQTQYSCGVCVDYVPSREPRSNVNWPRCICGHIAQDHN